MAYKRAKQRIKLLTPYLIKLNEFTEWLWLNLDIRASFDLIKEVECVKIQYEMEIHKASKIINQSSATVIIKKEK